MNNQINLLIGQEMKYFERMEKCESQWTCRETY